MSALAALMRDANRVTSHQPWPRVVVKRQAWSAAIDDLSQRRLTLLSLWGEAAAVQMALLDEPTGEIAVLGLDCPDGRFPSVGARHSPAQRLERTIADLFGIVAEGAGDVRPWLDHGRWAMRQPLGARVASPESPMPYAFLSAEGEGLHQIPVGPVHAGIIEPGHFRFTANGETVVRLEARLGYVHKGIDHLMAGAELETAAKLAGRTSGDSTVAYALAFARAVEAALAVEPPPRAHLLRALMAELERLANHLGDIGAVCNDAAFALMHAHCGMLREQVLRTADACFGHRLMRDRVVPGGVAADLDPSGQAAVGALVELLRGRFPALPRLYDNTASLLDRTVTTGILRPDLVRQFGAGGYVGRGSGRAFDARRLPGHAPYDRLDFTVPVQQEGDVHARLRIRMDEVEQSLRLVSQCLARLAPGPLRAELPRQPGEGMALVEGFRGDILAWIRLGPDGRVARCHLRDPSWFQWPLLEAAIEGNIVADFPLCNKSFNCSYSGHDL
ncbi:MAG: hydrogenase expression protein HypE [Alphaproteobacteria bacterium]|nr:hydrogenase expression protein HypE [Alphaproteobacteria bacterium]